MQKGIIGEDFNVLLYTLLCCFNSSMSMYYLFFFLFSWLSHMACGMLVSQQELNPCPLHWKHRVLTTGLPGKS